MTPQKEQQLKDLLAHMIGELYYPQFQSNTYEGADIPTRNVVDEYLPKVINLFEE